ncbi:thiamine pyrophosphate-dependent dehydrogenase E1 component subunit alpha [Pseudonocardia sp. DLS-67]
MIESEPELGRSDHLALFERMLLIRRAEETLAELRMESRFYGTVHLYIGQEASGVGACSVLGDRDWITSTHRGHGHFLAKGGDLKAMYAEIWGKRSGICRGMGGSMHVADLSKGILGANGIVGGGFAIATGAAYGASLRGDGRVAVCFFGDGAANQGSFMESMNVSAAWSLPTIFVCENNGVSEFTVSSTVTGGSIVERAGAFMPATVIDGNDVLAVRAAVGAAVGRARDGGGPSYVETVTYRTHGHFEGEDMLLQGTGSYRSAEEIAAWQAEERDPIGRYQRFLLDQGLAGTADIAERRSAVEEEVRAALAHADAAEPAEADLPERLMFAAAEG